eukprot:TRINITY_DN6043_c1_g1_i7.p1 TRINITY_DN6043_c1_g1~~TRINITY_DN6043_c1_g1_i7.p1  ORF type:complete len:143 (-),score=19.50 TRINITY_DN6043_c1_g1_i7:44-472(-)
MPWYHGEQKLTELTWQYEKLGYLRCTFGDGPDEEVVVNRYIGHEVNVKCCLMPHPINTDGLKELARGAFGIVYLLESQKVVKVTNPVPEESAKRYLRELQLWATADFGVKLESMGCKRENGMIQLMYVMGRYECDLTGYLQR